MVRIMELPCDIDWESLPGFVDTTTKVRFRIHVNGIPILCDTADDILELIQHLQQDPNCAAQRVAIAVRQAEKNAISPLQQRIDPRLHA